MLLNNAIYSLYSITASQEDVERAKCEIDRFLESLESEELKYSDAFFKYNVHSLVHPYEDRIKFKQPLSS